MQTNFTGHDFTTLHGRGVVLQVVPVLHMSPGLRYIVIEERFSKEIIHAVCIRPSRMKIIKIHRTPSILRGTGQSINTTHSAKPSVLVATKGPCTLVYFCQEFLCRAPLDGSPIYTHRRIWSSRGPQFVLYSAFITDLCLSPLGFSAQAGGIYGTSNCDILLN